MLAPAEISAPADSQDAQQTQPATEPRIKLRVKRNPDNWRRVGHRGVITGMLRANRIEDALNYARANNEPEWYAHKLAQFYPEKSAELAQTLADAPQLADTSANTIPATPSTTSDLPDSRRTIAIMLNVKDVKSAGEPATTQAPAQGEPTPGLAAGGAGVSAAANASNWDKSVPAGVNLQSDKPRSEEAITGGDSDVTKVGQFAWPEECEGKVVGTCANKQLMRLEVEVEVAMPGMGFVGNVVRAAKECSVWRGGYNLWVGEVVRVRRESVVGAECWYEVMARGVEMGGAARTNDGLTCAPVGFAGQAMRAAVEAVVEPVKAETPLPVGEAASQASDNVQDLVAKERAAAIREMEAEFKVGGSGSVL